MESELGMWTDLGPNTVMSESKFGDYSYTAGNCQIIYSDIGKFCSIATNVRLNPGNHPMWRVTQHHATYRRTNYGFAEGDDDDFFEWRRLHKVTIGNDVWIGHNVTVMPGVTVGNGAVIGSGAVVTKDVEPYMIVAGVPAKPIKRRFPLEIANKLEEIAWWNWKRKELEERFHEFNHIEAFIEKYGKEGE